MRLLCLKSVLAVAAALIAGCAQPESAEGPSDQSFASEEVPWAFTFPSGWEISTKRSEPDPRLKAGILSTYVATLAYPLDESSPGPNSTGGASTELGPSAAVVKVQLLWSPWNQPIPWNHPETASLMTDRAPSRWHDDAQNPGWVFRERRICLERACAWVLEWHGPGATENTISSLHRIAESIELVPDWTDPTA